MKTSKDIPFWHVNVLETDKGNSHYEISVIRSDYLHGHKSLGWAYPDKKIIVSSSGGPCCDKVPDTLFTMLISLAHKYAKILNESN